MVAGVWGGGWACESHKRLPKGTFTNAPTCPACGGLYPVEYKKVTIEMHIDSEEWKAFQRWREKRQKGSR